MADRELEEKGKRELLFNGYKVSVIQDEQILEMYNCVPVVSSTVPLRLKIKRVDLMLCSHHDKK